MENRTPQRDKAVRTRQRLLEATLAHTQLETSLCSQFDMESMQTLCLRIAVELLTPPHQTGSDTAVSCSH